MEGITELQLTAPPSVLSDHEQSQLADILSSPLMKKYLQTLIWAQIKDAAMIPLPDLVQVHEYALRQAFMKGGLSILNTLNSVHKPALKAQTPREPT